MGQTQFAEEQQRSLEEQANVAEAPQEANDVSEAKAEATDEITE